MKNKIYISEELDRKKNSPFNKGHIVYSIFKKYSFNDVMSNITGIDLGDIFEDIIISFDPQIYYPSKPSLKRCLVKAEKALSLMSYEFQFYVDTVFLDVSEAEINKVNHSDVVRNHIKRKLEDSDENSPVKLKGYFDLGGRKEIFGIFPGKVTMLKDVELDCLYVAYNCDLESYINDLNIVIEFIKIAIELEDPAIVFDLANNSQINL